MSYRGESPSKKYTRLQFWETGSKIVPDFTSKDALFLSGPDCGDGSVLLGLGMKPSRMHACDTDKHAVAAAIWKTPQIEVHHTDVFKYAERRSFGSVFLDFCGPLRESMIDKCAALIPRITKGGVFGIGLLAGREQGLLATSVKGCLSEYDGDSFLARAYMVTSALHHRRAKLRLRNGWYYVSHGQRRYGKPMIVLLYEVRAGRQPNPEKQIESAALEEVALTSSDLAQEILEADDAGKKATLLYNVTSGTLAACKAHRARGTYQ